ncbi:hypothetical protein C1Y40_01817 [Mycobacterium talmoniae]|uniref:Uncharacterized protein n=1 Tax=Mycobacterium talmoniae TaxID=1858794 RepID=A0A2S8BMS2_9MYCO|nr:hypothetical protein C1Y40_01817 [Mycobacterium talmoniae]
MAPSTYRSSSIESERAGEFWRSADLDIDRVVAVKRTPATRSSSGAGVSVEHAYVEVSR